MTEDGTEGNEKRNGRGKNVPPAGGRGCRRPAPAGQRGNPLGYPGQLHGNAGRRRRSRPGRRRFVTGRTKQDGIQAKGIPYKGMPFAFISDIEPMKAGRRAFAFSRIGGSRSNGRALAECIRVGGGRYRPIKREGLCMGHPYAPRRAQGEAVPFCAEVGRGGSSKAPAGIRAPYRFPGKCGFSQRARGFPKKLGTQRKRNARVYKEIARSKRDFLRRGNDGAV